MKSDSAVLPLSRQAGEQDLLALMLAYPQICPAVCHQVVPLRSHEFHDAACGRIYGAINVLLRRKMPISLSAVREELESWENDSLQADRSAVSRALSLLPRLEYSRAEYPLGDEALQSALSLVGRIKQCYASTLPPLAKLPDVIATLPLNGAAVAGAYANGRKEQNSAPQFSGSPQPLAARLLPVPALSPDILPAPLRGWLRDIAERMSCPLESPAVAALVALSSLVGRKCAICPKQYDDWTLAPNLWGVVVGPPGAQKTPVTEQGLEPLKRLAKIAFDEYAVELENYERECQTKASLQVVHFKKAAKLLF